MSFENMVNIKKIAQLTGHNAAIFSIIPGKDDRHFFSGAGDGWVVEWNQEEPDLGKLAAKVDTQIFALHYVQAQNVVAVGNMNGGLHFVNLEHPDLTKNIVHHKKGVFGIIELDKYLFSIGGGGTLTRWSLDGFHSIESFQLSNQSLRSIDYCKSRNELAIGASDHAIYLLDATTLTLKKTISKAHDNSVFCVKYSPKGNLLLSGGRDAHLRVWDLENDEKKIIEEAAHWFTINRIVFSPDEKYFATASRDKTLKIWDSENFKLLKVLETVRDNGHLNSVNNLLWSKHKNQLISCSDDRSMIIWGVNE